MSKASDLIEEYLSVGGLFNPEIMNQNQHDAVRDTLIIARDEIRRLEDRIKRLEEAENRLLNWLTEDCPEKVKKQLSNAWIKYKEAKP